MFPEGRALEFLLAAAVALVVVGPKDLPILMRKLGQFIGRMRAMAAEFRASFDEMARQSELDELRKEVEAMRQAQFADVQAGQAEVRDAFSDIQQNLSGIGTEASAARYHEAPSEPVAQPDPVAEQPAAPKPRAKRKPTESPATPKTASARTASAKAAPAAKTAKAAPKPRARKSAEPKA